MDAIALKLGTFLTVDLLQTSEHIPTDRFCRLGHAKQEPPLMRQLAMKAGPSAPRPLTAF